MTRILVSSAADQMQKNLPLGSYWEAFCLIPAQSACSAVFCGDDSASRNDSQWMRHIAERNESQVEWHFLGAEYVSHVPLLNFLMCVWLLKNTLVFYRGFLASENAADMSEFPFFIHLSSSKNFRCWTSHSQRYRIFRVERYEKELLSQKCYQTLFLDRNWFDIWFWVCNFTCSETQLNITFVYACLQIFINTWKEIEIRENNMSTLDRESEDFDSDLGIGTLLNESIQRGLDEQTGLCSLFLLFEVHIEVLSDEQFFMFNFQCLCGYST